MSTRTVQLTDHFDNFIEAGIASGRFIDAGEAVREGLRLLEQRDAEDRARVEWLRGAAREGFDAVGKGDYVAIRSEEELDQFFADLHQELAAEFAAE